MMMLVELLVPVVIMVLHIVLLVNDIMVFVMIQYISGRYIDTTNS